MGFLIDMKDATEYRLLYLQKQLSKLKRKPCLAIITADNYNNLNNVYFKNSISKVKDLGIDIELHSVDWEDTPIHEFRNYIFDLINKLNSAPNVDGIISKADFVIDSTENTEVFSKDTLKQDAVYIDFKKNVEDIILNNLLSVVEQTIDSYKFTYEYDFDNCEYIPF